MPIRETYVSQNSIRILQYIYKLQNIKSLFLYNFFLFTLLRTCTPVHVKYLLLIIKINVHIFVIFIELYCILILYKPIFYYFYTFIIVGDLVRVQNKLVVGVSASYSACCSVLHRFNCTKYQHHHNFHHHHYSWRSFR